jgi:hypothetical protein
MLGRLTLIGLVAVGAVANGLAAGPAHADRQATIDMTGIWGFKVSQNYCFPSCNRTYKLVQSGTNVHGTDGVDPILGNVDGNLVTFTIYTGISEDSYTISARVGPLSQRAQGRIINQIEPPGNVVGVKISSGS